MGRERRCQHARRRATDAIERLVYGANLYTTAKKSVGFEIDYNRMLRELQSRGYLLRASYYRAVGLHAGLERCARRCNCF
jgi:uncharacterized LabA/DUF88 family protein